jgi:hypothetical protein
VPGVDARPQVDHLEFGDGRSYDRVTWLTPSGQPFSQDTGGPASQHGRGLGRNTDALPASVALTVSEALALPGTRSEYHFLILSAWHALYAGRRHDPLALRWVEALCLADITLLELGPELVFDKQSWGDSDDHRYPIVAPFDQLSSLYHREGFLAAAVGIEQRCAALGTTRPVGTEAIARQAALLTEEGR